MHEEFAALGWLQALGYELLYGPRGDPAPSARHWFDVVLTERLHRALRRHSHNPHIPAAALDNAFRNMKLPLSIFLSRT